MSASLKVISSSSNYVRLRHVRRCSYSYFQETFMVPGGKLNLVNCTVCWRRLMFVTTLLVTDSLHWKGPQYNDYATNITLSSTSFFHMKLHSLFLINQCLMFLIIFFNNQTHFVFMIFNNLTNVTINILAKKVG